MGGAGAPPARPRGGGAGTGRGRRGIGAAPRLRDQPVHSRQPAARTGEPLALPDGADGELRAARIRLDPRRRRRHRRARPADARLLPLGGPLDPGRARALAHRLHRHQLRRVLRGLPRRTGPGARRRRLPGALPLLRRLPGGAPAVRAGGILARQAPAARHRRQGAGGGLSALRAAARPGARLARLRAFDPPRRDLLARRRQRLLPPPRPVPAEPAGHRLRALHDCSWRSPAGRCSRRRCRSR